MGDRLKFSILFLLSACLVLSPNSATSAEDTSIKIGLNADLGSVMARGGEAIKRGALLAIEEINADGGVLNGRKLKLLTRDHRGNPDRGQSNIKKFIAEDQVDVLLGGIHTPVVMSELELVHEYPMLYLIPWAAGTPIVENGFEPNFVFRLSVRDEYAGGFVTEYIASQGHRKMALLLERTPWGRSNERAVQRVAEKFDLDIVRTEWFNWGERDYTDYLVNIEKSGATVVFIVCNSLEGSFIVRDMAQRPFKKRLPIVSHWGISGGNFFDSAGEFLDQIDLKFLQTYSFLPETKSGKNLQFAKRYQQRFNVDKAADIFAPAGTAHAYDLIHLYAKAVDQAQSVNPDQVRIALEDIAEHVGLLKTYAYPFTADNHDALSAQDFSIAEFAADGSIQTIYRRPIQTNQNVSLTDNLNESIE